MNRLFFDTPRYTCHRLQVTAEEEENPAARPSPPHSLSPCAIGLSRFPNTGTGGSGGECRNRSCSWLESLEKLKESEK